METTPSLKNLLHITITTTNITFLYLSQRENLSKTGARYDTSNNYQFQKEKKKKKRLKSNFVNESIYNEIPRKMRETKVISDDRHLPFGKTRTTRSPNDLSPKSNSTGNSWAQNEIINRKKILSVHGANLPRTIKISGRIENVNGAG